MTVDGAIGVNHSLDESKALCRARSQVINWNELPSMKPKRSPLPSQRSDVEVPTVGASVRVKACPPEFSQ